ncbi:MAG: hypothetical protein QOG16_201, partial [Actinomycetota bacterium]|nr:hypothetical protein [Actinomycetota bacterium]
MRKTIVLILALSLMVALLGPASAQKKQKPVTFKASGSIRGADVVDAWVINGPTSLTAREFYDTCDIPSTQGVDGYVVELSDEISKVPARVSLDWPSPTGISLSMEFLNADCTKWTYAGQYDGNVRGTEKASFKAGT